ncbi:aminotransferase class I/II-fold pyridoxal phosphate-dependent enzyme [Egicoccus halophilus]|uniref:Aminotransferase n=1 Tax=Egicoccus halophilus TaxID=1670830 RepID=A0A8J3AFF6_9ACTN|nr:aminotransferase class I/II-fold pyridoxal phosphate-dependent enzyme [Egicoccus halophilus]GGI07928.1 aminotransferase [Egicoccus halophilus]
MSERPTAPLVARMRGFGTTIFGEMTALALAHDAVNLGQGFPDEDPPALMVDAVVDAMRAGHHQYAPGPGVAALRRAVADHQRRCYSLELDPDTEISITFGATEAVAASLLALCEPGDEVLVLEPTYDAYTAVLTLAGAVEVRVPLRAPDFALDLDALRAAVTPRTRLVLLNTPHNPTGTVLSDAALAAVAELCREHDLLAVTDEVYEHLVYDGRHRPLATWPGMRERTVTVSSAGKTFSCTGWKVGWACAPPPLTAALRTTKQFLSFSGGTPLQYGVAAGLDAGDAWFDALRERHRRRRDLVVDRLRAGGAAVHSPAGGYFVTLDVRSLGHEDGEAFCRWAPAALGVAAVPVAAFVRDPAPVRSLVRLAICKPEPVLAEGVDRLLHARDVAGARP